MSKVKCSELGQLADIDISGVDKKIKDKEQLVRLCNFVDVYYNWAISKETARNFMEASANPNEVARFTIKKGQVALTKDSETRQDIGTAAYIADNFERTLLGYHCALITPHESLLKGNYLNAFLHTSFAQKHFANKAGGSGQRYTLTVEALSSLKVPLPSLEKQELIGDFFSYIDRKIENNKRINAELETMAKVIFDYWFLQFNFPNEDGKPYKSSGGKLVWNEELKREIPEGWRSAKIGDILGKISKTKSYNVTEYHNGSKYPIIDQSKEYICGFTDDEFSLLDLKDCIVFGDHTKIVKYINFPFARGADGTQIIMSTMEELPNYLLYQQMLSMELVSQGYSRYFKFLKDKSVLIPNKDIAEAYMRKVDFMLKMAHKNRTENHELARLRDFLLPLLINGQVGFVENK